MSEYLKNIIQNLESIEKQEADKIQKVSRLVADVIKKDGLIHIFGCGHSHLPGLDAFYRAGGLANVSPLLDTDLMLHNGAAKSSRMEKMGGIAPEVFRRYNIDKNDIIFVLSASGKNQAPVEMAQKAKKPELLLWESARPNILKKVGGFTSALILPLIARCLTAMHRWR